MDNKHLVIGISAALLLAAGPSVFAAPSDNPWTLGAGYGATLLDSGLKKGVGDPSRDQTDSGYQLFAGYRVNDYLGAEAFFAD